MRSFAAARAAVGDRPVVVTGASSGVGAALARGLAAPGVHLVLVARRVPLLEEVAADVRAAGGTARVVGLDLRDPEAAYAVAGELAADGPAPGAVVSNAGKSIMRPLADALDRPQDVVRTAATNYVGAACFALPLLAVMAAAGDGVLVQVSSTTARLPVPGWGAYAASKGAMDLWVRSAAPELADLGVRAAVVELPLVATPMSEPTYGAAPRWALSPKRAAARVAAAIARPRTLASPWWARLGAAAAAAAPGAAPALAHRVTRRR